MNAELADQMTFYHHGDTEMHGDSALVNLRILGVLRGGRGGVNPTSRQIWLPVLR